MAKYYYNGHLLPEIPSDITVQYPYLIITKSGTLFRIYGSTSAIYYYKYDSDYYAAKIPANLVRISLDKTTGEWGEPEESTSSTSIVFKPEMSNSWVLLWSNSDIENTSVTGGSDIYFYNSYPLPVIPNSNYVLFTSNDVYPQFPEEAIVSYPYMAIVKNNIGVRLICSENGFGYSSGSDCIADKKGSLIKVYTITDNIWVEDSNNSLKKTVWDFVSDSQMLYTNQNILNAQNQIEFLGYTPPVMYAGNTGDYYKISGDTLRNLAQEARRLGNYYWPMTPDQMVTVFSQASGSGGSLEGLKNGYDVMFYDEFGDGLALVSVRKGLSVDAPDYSCKAWLTIDGKSQFFPIKPTDDIAFYAYNDSLEKILYEYYGIDKAAYPYLLITHAMESGASLTYYLSISFGTSVSITGTTSTSVTGFGARVRMTADEIGDFSPEHIVNLVMQTLPVLSDGFKTYAGYNTNHHDYSNFAITTSSAIRYRLDE